MLSDKDCNKFKPVKKQSVISKLVTSEGSGGVEPDQSQLERMVEHKQFHMKFRIGEEFISDENGEFGKLEIVLSYQWKCPGLGRSVSLDIYIQIV